MCAALSTKRGSFENVMRSHSSAMLRDESAGSQHKRPKAYQLEAPKGWPHQLRSLPMLVTAHMPVRSCPCSEPSITLATLEPGPAAKVSLSRHSLNIGARYARWVAQPRYSCVSCSSRSSGVLGMAPNKG